MKNNAFVRTLCRILVVCMVVSPLSAHAGLIGTDSVAGNAADATAARQAIVSQLEALGIAADSARERVAAISDAEALEVAGRIDQLPAGAIAGQTVGMLIVVAFLIWRFGFSDQAKAEAAAKEPAKKQ